jgi:hypothetical protein
MKKIQKYEEKNSNLNKYINSEQKKKKRKKKKENEK